MMQWEFHWCKNCMRNFATDFEGVRAQKQHNESELSLQVLMRTYELFADI